MGPGTKINKGAKVSIINYYWCDKNRVSLEIIK